MNRQKEIVNAKLLFEDGDEREAYQHLIHFGVSEKLAREFIYEWYLENDAGTLKTYLVKWITPYLEGGRIVNACNVQEAKELGIPANDRDWVKPQDIHVVEVDVHTPGVAAEMIVWD